MMETARILSFARTLCLAFAVASCASSPSTESFKDDLDFTIAEVEYNYPGYALLTESELTEYNVMTAAVRDNVDEWVLWVAEDLKKKAGPETE